MSTLSSTSIERCAASIGATFELRAAWGRDLPLVTPPHEGAIAELVRFAARERLVIAPIGLGSRVETFAPPPRIDVLVSTKRCTGVVAYEPGDGVLTALAGTTWAEIEACAARGGHHVSPSLPAPHTTTLGGAIGAGASGSDRLRHGPLRHQVLGVRAVQADGTITKSGGRLVKNVTGYDLQRLYTGSRGSLAIVVEASLRLHALASADAIVTASFAEHAQALAAADVLLRPPFSPLTVAVHDLCPQKSARWTLHAVLAGRAETVAFECERAAALLPQARIFCGACHSSPVDRMRGEIRDLARPGAWPAFEIGGSRTSLAPLFARIEALAHERGVAWHALAHPGIATLSAWCEVDAAFADAVRRIADDCGATVTWRAISNDVRARLAAAPRADAALQRALKASFDPHGVFVEGP